MTPVLALVVWTLVILVWLYARRIPAMRKAGIDPKMIKGSESYASLPPMNPKAVWVADNYNHLHEQPTIFYALCVYSHLAGVVDGFSVGLAWAYVAIRILHSFIQVTTNFVPLRFVVFNIGSLVLMILAVVNVLGLFGVYTVGAQ
ncbi:MAG TPA: MAPEG family protein [Hyphomonadaceae bacterium]|nr:MAPEG family protein [Hyphomonadaceae bacterium]